ncbi:RNA polymerase sigma factor [Shewanella inventionis]|uniref:DNA-directed RNA polymerase sigma-70 factor n=1 Tax=Shewanella inventionis TaxID=1738770 RepID=A0ABQ1JNG8_9GAMM|nr:RNA polymerase sigma factor [Shewanella inventionis]MCL1159070.1 RNA polymerase sigma factor [Shewanella inventionis]UAL43237.1 RNA polymerase sigma factor [Shewanella inventionis]GGB71112.1 DNA-directed RNA polymerase sigma-70 factor [Shewanella inventionis]
MKTELTTLLPALRRFAYSLTGSMPDADDLVQNTLLRILNSPPPEGVPLAKWAFKICRNQWIDDYRAQKVRTLATTKPELQSENYSDGEADMINDITLSEVNQAMNSLSDDQREVLSLIAVQGMSYTEAADVLSIPTGTIMSRLARARANMVSFFKQPNGSMA